MKPNQLSANERLPYRLIRNGQEEKLYNYVNAGLIDIDYGVHGHSLFATALQAENIGVINFLIDKKVKNLNNVMYALSQVKNGDIKRVSEEYFLKNNG